jgi:hypothetical protein
MGHTLWAWLAEPPGKTPYTIGWTPAPDQAWLPLISPRRDLMEQMEAVARLHAAAAGVPVRLVRFDEAAS